MLLWGAFWQSRNAQEGHIKHPLYRDGVPALFRTRREAREWIESRYGYIRNRPDLRAEPHGWRMPIPVKAGIVWERDGGVR